VSRVGDDCRAVATAPALCAVEVTKEYRRGRELPVRAVQGVSIELAEGGTLGIVGESGSGKSTLARLLVGLEPPSSGQVELAGRPLRSRSRLELAREIQLVFQDPFSSLDPRLTVAAALSEVLAVHRLRRGRAARLERVKELLAMVALGPRFAERYPHELSGGQAQRVAIARALAVGPEVLVLDEPTSALDVSVRAEVVNLLIRLQDELGLSYVFITHDLLMVRHVADVIVVMYLGKVVEQGSWSAVLDNPLHPYTRALADAVPRPGPEAEALRRGLAGGEAPSAGGAPATGCPYQPRCPIAEESCRVQVPQLEELEPGHLAACQVVARFTRRRGGATS
jgi:oligopeptide/dipeptide ABC transporter ATP-binding protein